MTVGRMELGLRISLLSYLPPEVSTQAFGAGRIMERSETRNWQEKSGYGELNLQPSMPVS